MQIIRKKLNKVLSKLEVLKEDLVDTKDGIEQLELRASLHEEAKQVLQKASQITQGTLKEFLEGLVSEALQIVFLDEAKKFHVEFIPRRGVSECDLKFEFNGNLVDPLGNSGFGEADVASFALRLGYWSLGNTRSVIIVDEPFRNLDSDRMVRATEMIRAITDKLGVQLIMVSHIPELRQECDVEFKVVNKNGNAVVSNHG